MYMKLSNVIVFSDISEPLAKMYYYSPKRTVLTLPPSICLLKCIMIITDNANYMLYLFWTTHLFLKGFQFKYKLCGRVTILRFMGYHDKLVHQPLTRIYKKKYGGTLLYKGRGYKSVLFPRSG